MRVGTICYSTRQGIGWLPKRFYDAGVITDVMTFRHGSRQGHPEWYPPGTVELVGRPFSGPVVEDFIRSVDVILFFETPFDWDVLDLIRRLGKKSVIVPMYEWLPLKRPYEPDKWICPSPLDQKYLPGSPFLEIPVEVGSWRLRTKATRFLHGAGNLGTREHKGTRQILEAFKLLRTPVDLTVHAQDERFFRIMFSQVFGVTGSALFDGSVIDNQHGAKLTIKLGDGVYEDLYAHHDVFVMAEKYNGLSLPLREARATGMVVMTSDRFPMNTWLPNQFLIPVAGYSKQRVGGSYHEYDEATVTPEAIAAKLDEVNGRDISLDSIKSGDWALAHSWAALKDAWMEELAK